jgi:dTDP-4-amino-4,6-dideoxygalactose transaminase
MAHYNPWPLGQLPRDWQRQEPNMIRELGYEWSDPRDIIGIFEAKLAEYSGAQYCVVTDCCSHALFLALKYRCLDGYVTIPENTYVSVPMQILHAGYRVRFAKQQWNGIYRLDPVNIYDGAGRFRRGMYSGGGSLHTLSFQIKKRLPIGRGGAILTDSFEAYRWLKLASYDGRDLETPYPSREHVSTIGWHYYMTPEDAARGIMLMDQLGDDLDDTMSSENYPSLLNYQFNFER